jgi:hypothetical protein
MPVDAYGSAKDQAGPPAACWKDPEARYRTQPHHRPSARDLHITSRPLLLNFTTPVPWKVTRPPRESQVSLRTRNLVQPLAGGSITFDCGSSPITMLVTSSKTISVDTSIVGGGRITPVSLDSLTLNVR